MIREHELETQLIREMIREEETATKMKLIREID